MMALAAAKQGSGSERAKALLATLGRTVAWYGETHLLCRGIEKLLADFAVLATTRAGVALCRAAGYRTLEPAALAAGTVPGPPLSVLAFKPTAELREAARLVQDLKLLCPAPELVAQLGDKTRLPGLLADSGAPGIASYVIEQAGPDLAQAIWDRLRCERLVVQRPENDLIGRGTFLVTSLAELESVLARLDGTALKVARFVEGELFTISACACRQGTVTSYLSRQLVGLPELTDEWGAHCGNDALPESGLEPETLQVIRAFTRSLGDRLVEHGFLGVFGLDLLIDRSGAPAVIEINPRLQSVSALVNATEIDRGAFPLLAHHILAFHGVEASAETPERDHACPFAQVILLNRGPRQRIRRSLSSGLYRLDKKTGLSRIRPGADLTDLSRADEFLVTLRLVAGETLAPGQRLADLQHRGPLTEGNRLTPQAVRFIDSLGLQLGLDPAWRGRRNT